MSATSGLTTEQAAQLLEKHGPNELPRGAPPSVAGIFIRQFKGLLILILALAAGIALVLGEHIDALAIGMVLLLNALLGFVQEWRAETALEALRAILQPSAVVVRDGQEIMIPSREIVPGDLVLIETGDTIPADIAISDNTEISIDESALTGESVPVSKCTGDDGDAGLLFAGTSVLAGRAEGIVSATGTATRFGKVADLTARIEEKPTNLQQRLGKLARDIGTAALLVAGLVIALGVLMGRPPVEMFMTGLSLAVAIVPEGLPAVVTVTLALGASAMARRNALVRQLQAIETIGAASVICTDKTGTLTENQMTVTKIWTADRNYEVTGTGYDPAGHISCDGQKVRADNDPTLDQFLETALACNHATLQHSDSGWNMIGMPTEGALVTLAFKGWAPDIPPDARLAENPFSSDRKRMSVLLQAGSAQKLHVKGAPEAIVERCTKVLTKSGPVQLTGEHRTKINAAYERMASRGQRVLALASRDASLNNTEEENLVFLGLAGLVDPPRKEVSAAIRHAKAAGIRILMVTGDASMTASAIAKDIGLDPGDFLEGPEIDALSDAELQLRLKKPVHFARTRPEHKMRIVAALQAEQQIVAMTGDGVNDAPALKRADIGVAMGIRGTDVSKGAADLILLDDNFASIVSAVQEGRRQFDNLRKFVRYLLSSNAGEVIAILVNLLIGGPLVFLATQILWMNLITDSLTAVALGLEPSEKSQMQRPPRSPDAAILGRPGLLTLLAFGTYTGAASLFLFYVFLPSGVDVARTAAFTGMVVFEKVSVFAFRSLHMPCSAIGWFSNRFLILAFSASLLAQVAAVYWAPLQTLLRTVPLSLEHWSWIALAALPLVVVPEIIKLTRRGSAAHA
ncbi:cation-translocating P-type ATPase [Tropicimonas sp. S265A]|uniref:cation-translocating P-type ATPase n=1 Tax=Tropicimonas sp. S265A TaxID=3415134 RepID=UPI003C7BDCCD